MNTLEPYAAMTTTSVPLDEVAQRIARQQAELAALRKEYETRQASLGKLQRRKQELQHQLAQVEQQMQVITQGRQSPAEAAPVSAPATKAAAGQPKGKQDSTPSMPTLLVELVRQADRALTTRQLTEALQRRKYPTTSSNLFAVVEARVNELVRKGVLRKSKDQPGYLLAPGTPSTQPTPSPRSLPTSPKPNKSVGSSSAKTVAKTAAGQPSLQQLLVKLLARSKQPLTGAELARQVKAAGYRSTSQDLTKSVWNKLGQMDNVEHAPGQGYRLKK